MKGYDVIAELYYGNINPNERGYHEDTMYATAMDAFATHEAWFNAHLTNEAKTRFEELMHCHDTINNTVSLENFRIGFQLGVMLMMDAVGENRRIFYDL